VAASIISMSIATARQGFYLAFRSDSGQGPNIAADMGKRPMVLMSALLCLAAAGCGSSGSSSTTSAAPSTQSATASSSTSSSSPSGGAASGGSTGGGVNALSAEAQSVATGDIPDNQAFLTFTNAVAGYSIVYPEGWTRKGDGANVTFSDKNNIIHIVVRKGAAPTAASVDAELKALQQQNSTLKFTPPQTITLRSGPAIKTTYTTQSAQNAVTGKSVLLIVDRYELSRAGNRATVDLGTAKGVDNVDAYKKISNSFRWR
jgi:hypothetical protein